MPLISVQFRSQPIEVDPLKIPLIVNPMTKKIAVSYCGNIPAFIAPTESLVGRIRSLSDLEAELKQAENSKNEQALLQSKLQKEVEKIDQFLDEKEKVLNELEREKEKVGQEYSKKSLEKKSLKDELEKNQLVKEANKELEEAIANVDKFRTELKQTQAENQYQTLMSLLKIAATVALAAAGILMRRPILAKQSGRLLWMGGILSSLSLGVYFAKEAFTRISRLENEEEKLSLSVKEKGKKLDSLKKIPNGMNEEIKALEEKFDQLKKEQDRIIEETDPKEKLRENLAARFNHAQGKQKIAEEQLRESSEKQSACLEEIRTEMSKEDLRSCNKYFRGMKIQVAQAVRELEEASVLIRISESTKRKNPDYKESKKEIEQLRDAKSQVAEKAQFAGIAPKGLDAEFADQVESYYKTVLEECIHVVEFIEKIDPCDDPETPEFYVKCEELLNTFSQKIKSFETIDKEMLAFLKKMDLPYSDDLSKVMKDLKKKTGGDPKNISDVLKVMHEKSKKIIALLKQNFGEEDDDEQEALEGKLSEQFNLFFRASDELRKIYSKNMRGCNPQATKHFNEFNALHQRFCDSFLEVLSAGDLVAEKFDLADNFDLVYEGWKKITG